jgi:hypothetical protein
MIPVRCQHVIASGGSGSGSEYQSPENREAIAFVKHMCGIPGGGELCGGGFQRLVQESFAAAARPRKPAAAYEFPKRLL